MIDLDNAEVACVMFQELYKHNPDIKKHINAFFDQRPKTVKQLTEDEGASLKSLLIATRIYEEGTGITSPLEDDPRVIRREHRSWPDGIRAMELKSITIFNTAYKKNHQQEARDEKVGPKDEFQAKGPK